MPKGAVLHFRFVDIVIPSFPKTGSRQEKFVFERIPSQIIVYIVMLSPQTPRCLCPHASSAGLKDAVAHAFRLPEWCS
jgi:hypothetical protein